MLRSPLKIILFSHQIFPEILLK